MDSFYFQYYINFDKKEAFYIYLATCGDPRPVNGSVNATKSPIVIGYYSVGTNVAFSCDPGYELEGSISSTCDDSGSWNPPPPTCKGK